MTRARYRHRLTSMGIYTTSTSAGRSTSHGRRSWFRFLSHVARRANTSTCPLPTGSDFPGPGRRGRKKVVDGCPCTSVQSDFSLDTCFIMKPRSYGNQPVASIVSSTLHKNTDFVRLHIGSTSTGSLASVTHSVTRVVRSGGGSSSITFIVSSHISII